VSIPVYLLSGKATIPAAPASLEDSTNEKDGNDLQSTKRKGLVKEDIMIFNGPDMQGCGSESGLDPDSVALWIRIRLGIRIPDLEARKLRNFSGKMHFLVIFKKISPLKRYEKF
jgi:hypothetical protein